MGRPKRDESHLSVVDAVETLSSIADLPADFHEDEDVEAEKEREIYIDGERIVYERFVWIQEEDREKAVKVIRESFRVILDYLKRVYKNRVLHAPHDQTVEGIKTIMVLVGEAAKKLDKYTDLFKAAHIGSATELEEYKQLQDFYQKKIDKKIDTSLLGKWLLGLTESAFQMESDFVFQGKTEEGTRHVFIDLEGVKADSDYELMLLRKEDGSRFYNTRLLRNLKLVCGFGKSNGDETERTSPLDVNEWQNVRVHLSAKKMLQILGSHLTEFFSLTSKHSRRELGDLLQRTLIALMMAANPHNLSKNQPKKSCMDYFKDFLRFLRDALHSRDYQRLLLYPPARNKDLSFCFVNLTHALCKAFFLYGVGDHALTEDLEKLLLTSKKAGRGSTFTEDLLIDYAALESLLKPHKQGPLVKILDLIEEQAYQRFDPIEQGSYPCNAFDLFICNKKIFYVRAPCPTFQDFIHRAAIVDEFKGFLRSIKDTIKDGLHIVFNLQDRTSWKEHTRASCLEALQGQPEFEENLQVVTLSVDTDFYTQSGPYEDISRADYFKDQLREHVEGIGSGYLFPEKLHKKLFPQVSKKMIEAIHTLFFGSRNVLARKDRVAFLEIFTLFMELKILEMESPTSFSISCKDGLDLSSSHAALFYLFVNLMQGGLLGQEDRRYVDFLLYMPALLSRERVLLKERFRRFSDTLAILESAVDAVGFPEFQKRLFQTFDTVFKRKTLETISCARPKL